MYSKKTNLNQTGARFWKPPSLPDATGSMTSKATILAERRELKALVKDKSRWGEMPDLLGGWSERKDPKGKLIDGEAATWTEPRALEDKFDVI